VGSVPASAEPDRPERTGSDPYESARAIALRSLTTGDRTRAQLDALLARKGVAGPVAAEVLDRLEQVGLVDDAAYAARWVASRHAGRGLARRAVGQELARRGVPDALAAAALQSIDPLQEEERARELVAARLPATRGLEVAVRARRLVGMLARKGYPPGLATRVTREALALEPDVDAPGRRFLDDLDGPLSDLARSGE
jgi:regulatory protein